MNRLDIDKLRFARNGLIVFEDLSASWQSGDIVQILGTNGAGKTTLLKLILGLSQALSGQIRWNGKTISTGIVEQNTLYLGHQAALKSTLSPFENLQWYFALNGAKASEAFSVDTDQLMKALDQVGLYSYEHTPCYQLSEGQKRRAALARLTLSKAPLWVLDEPFTAIDKIGLVWLSELIERRAAEGGIILLTAHQAWTSKKIKTLDLSDFAAKRERYVS